jgi:DNA-directed RNA polymerase sigma subunit (sigma70/sigma32)
VISAVARKRALRDRAELDLRRAIKAAFDSRNGYTVEDIAKAAGLTRERIYQVVKENPRGA